MAQQEDEWLSAWPDSPHYHMLQNTRDLRNAHLATGANDMRQCPFEERVRALPENFSACSSMVQMCLLEVPGDYDPNPFVREQSARMVFVPKR